MIVGSDSALGMAINEPPCCHATGTVAVVESTGHIELDTPVVHIWFYTATSYRPHAPLQMHQSRTRRLSSCPGPREKGPPQRAPP